MALNFPSSPTEGQVFHNNFRGPIFIYKSGVWTRNYGTASRVNILVNPTLQVSQQNGSNPAMNTHNYFFADQWAQFVVSPDVNDQVNMYRSPGNIPGGYTGGSWFAIYMAVSVGGGP
jgi:hypothetical protein